MLFIITRVPHYFPLHNNNSGKTMTYTSIHTYIHTYVHYNTYTTICVDEENVWSLFAVIKRDGACIIFIPMSTIIMNGHFLDLYKIKKKNKNTKLILLYEHYTQSVLSFRIIFEGLQYQYYVYVCECGITLRYMVLIIRWHIA